MARILVKGDIVDAYAVVLDSKMSYAGNVLTEEELTNLSEEEIIKRLSLPEGLNNANDRVIPDGQIPFMIVFTRDQPGVIKTTVMIAGAEMVALKHSSWFIAHSLNGDELRYEGNVFRPFSEANSYLLQCTIGVPIISAPSAACIKT